MMLEKLNNKIKVFDGVDLRGLLKEGGRELGVAVSDNEIALFLRYLQELKEWGRKINLTAIKDEKEIAVRHFLDSLSVVKSLGDGKSLLDIGSGAGFPGIPLKIARPDLGVVLLDSVGKKVHFMRNVIRALGLRGIEAIHGRAEDRSLLKRFAGSFDIVTSRAFSRLRGFLEVSLPYLKEGGIIIAIKGPKGSSELKDAAELKNIELIKIDEVILPFSDVTVQHLIFKKSWEGK
ncbi:MAG: 16S rRNA (guanine(527)-N(7))-methyltransferase RsmG [Thermodesulfobacteriota bacterium]